MCVIEHESRSGSEIGLIAGRGELGLPDPAHSPSKRHALGSPYKRNEHTNEFQAYF